MPYTTTAQVKALLGPNYDNINMPDLQQFIDTATVMVAGISAYGTRRATDPAISTAELEIIERWLSAHMYAIQDPTYRSRQTLAASGVFDGTTDMYLEATRYGQQALALDRSGYLRTIGNKVMLVAGAFKIGGNDLCPCVGPTS